MNYCIFQATFVSALFVTLLGSCSKSDFSGMNGNNTKKPEIQRTDGGDQNPESVDPSNPSSEGSDSGALESGSGGIEGCALGTMVEDPNAVGTFTGYDARDQINALPDGYTQIPSSKAYAGAFHFDKATSDAVCRILGYLESTSSIQSKFSSCGDNAIATWDEAKKDFNVAGACVSNSKIKTVDCKGKLKDPCLKDKSWVFKK